MKNIFKITFLVFTVFCLLYIISPVQAQTLGNEYLTNFGQVAGYGEAGLPEIIGRIVKIGLGLLGLIAVIIMIAGGFIWMSSGGVTEKVAKAKKVISSGLIGLLIIVFAYAIVSFIMSRLSGVTGEGIGDGGGCTPSLCCGPGLRCDSGGDCNISDSGCTFPPDVFRIKKIETAHGGYVENYNEDVYLCSAVQPIFNHSVDSAVIEDLAQANELRVEGVTGTWQTRNNTLIFKHPDLFTENTSYEAYFPKAILDSQGRILQQCLAAGTCVSAGNYFIWNFNTGTTVDIVPPEIISTYPIFNQTDPNYPDQEISTRPVIEVGFSESIDITTVADENNYPIETNIWLSELTEQNGSVELVLSKDLFEIRGGDNGFEIHLRNENLESFTWYRIHIEGVEDLCLNAMDTAIEWEFKTNGQVPGVSSQYPTGDNVCPDTDITIAFNTQMYNNLVRFEITGGDDFTFDIRGSELSPPYEKEVVGGVFKITDPGDPINNNFRVFTFDPDDNLQSEADYQVTVLTDLVADEQGTLLSHTWEFTTTTMGDCFCTPWISRLEPAQGSKGECITLYGSCFEGKSTQPASPIKLEFILDGIPTQVLINGFGNNYLTTQVPSLYSEGNQPEVQVTIEYDSGDQLISNLVEFYVDSNEQANGPCLFFANPSAGYSDETEVDLSGIRFGTESAESQVVFYNNKSAGYQTWEEQQINNALVPLGSEDGLVYLVNNQGTSNGLPFDVLQHLAESGGICQQMTDCPDNPPYDCLTPIYNCMYEATDTCRCCCDVILNSCENPLECMANQGSCTGDDRGLCCGCESDDQCGNGLGCGFLDTNQCCYARPTIISNSPTGEAVCLNTAIEANFSQEMDYNSLNEDNIQLIKLPSLVESKFGRNYISGGSQYTACLSQSSIYTGRCDVNWWDYSFDVSANGDYQIYVETSNYSADVKDFGEDGVCSEPGVQHHVKVFVDSVEKGDFCADATLGHQISNVSLENITAGNHTIRLEWDNEWFESPHDSNIRIYQVDLRQEASEENVNVNLIVNQDNNQISLLPTDCNLDVETGYKVELIGGMDGQGIRDSMGVSMNNYNWQFTTGDENDICEINSVLVSPESAIVEFFEDNVVYMAQGYDFYNNQVCVAEFLWESDDVSIAMVSPSQGLETIVSPVGGEGEQSTDIFAIILWHSDSGEFISVLSPPVITSLSPNSGNPNPAIPTYVTIIGTNFGEEQNDSYIQFGDFEAEIGCQNWSDTEIVVIVPPDLTIDQSYSVIVTSDQGQSNNMSFNVTDEFHPAICQLRPNQGKTGTLIAIEGVNFGDYQGDSYVIFGQEPNSQIIDEIEEDDWFNTQIVITAPEVPEEVANVVVYVPSPIEAGNPVKSSNTVSFYKLPRITSISPEQGPERTWITIRGENFGSTKGNVYFKYDDEDYLAEELSSHCLSYWTNQEIIIVVPETLPDVAVEDNFYQTQVYIEVANANSTQSNLFEWEVNKEALAPALCGITPNEDLQVNALVDIVGDRFDLGSGELNRRLIFNQDRVATSLVWTSNTEIGNAVLPLGTISGDLFIEKDVEINCHLECDGFSFAGQCFGTMIEVCNNAQIRSNPLSITLLPPGDPQTFDLPQVFEDSACSNNTQTPSPRYLSSQVCLNALILARFNMEVNNLSDTNIIVEKCNQGNEDFDSGLCLTNVNGTIVETEKSFDNPQHNTVDLYPDITTANRFCFEQGYAGFKASSSTSTTALVGDYIRYVDGEWVEENSAERVDTVLCSKGFIYTPTILLSSNYWYQVTLKSGETGIKNADSSYQLDGNKDGIEDGSPNDDYIWYFKTKNEPEACSAQTIEIFEENPGGVQDPVGVIVKPGTKNYSALPIGPDCQILRPDTFTWEWQSTEISVATVAIQTLAYTAIATAVDLGETEIKVIATPSTGGESATDSVDLVVATDPSVESFQPSGDDVCRNSTIKATFDQLMNRSSSFNEKINFYKWDDPWQEWQDITSTINISTFDKDFAETNDLTNPQHSSGYLYPDNATAQQYCFDQGYDGFDLYTTTTTSGDYMRYNNGAWSITGHESYIATLTCYNENIKTIVNINAGLLDSNQQYKVTILGGENGVESIYGINMVADYNSTFTASDEICTLSRVDIEPKTIDFTVGGEERVLVANTYDNQGNSIFGISGVYDWTWSWESSDPAIVSITESSSENETATAQNKNGQVQITATAIPSSGDRVSGQSRIDVFICEDAWDIYQDLETNFELRYCIDEVVNEGAEPLPELLPASIQGSDPLIKEFLFSVGDTGDAIGLKVFNNPKRLSVLNWYNLNAPNPGNPGSFVIDNYYALREGRTTYVGATNVVESTFNNPQHDLYYLYPDNATADQFCIEKGFSGADDFSYIYIYDEEDVKQYTGEWSVLGHHDQKISSIICNSSLENGIHNHIYLMSYNDNASSQTIETFSQLLDNWQFNINLDDPFNDKSKLQNDLLRLYNIEEIKDKLSDYNQDQGKYPTLGGGTYVSGKTNSLWSSWQNILAQFLEGTLPIDPINEFNGSCGNCIDDIPDGSHVYQYYAPDIADCWGKYYTLSINLEYGDGGVIWKGVEDITTLRADSDGNFNYIYMSPGTPVCGDGILQCGEECDCGGNLSACCSPYTTNHCTGATSPPNAQFIPEETCESLEFNNVPTGFLECNNNCFWSNVSCAKNVDGEACGTDDNLCHSGHCVDEVCCNNSCDGTCQYCGEGLGGSAGTCHDVSAGNDNDPDDECDDDASGCLTGNCNGDGTCDHSYTDGLKHNCSICQTCNASGNCAGITDTGSVPIDTACTNCKKCLNGSCVDQESTQDLFDYCGLTWNSCPSDCVRGGGDGLCNGSGGCNTDGRQTEYIESGDVCDIISNNGSVIAVSVAVSDSNYCETPEDSCMENSCSGTRWYRSCGDGTGDCRSEGDYTDSHKEIIKASSNNVLITDCSQVSRSISNYCGTIINDCTGTIINEYVNPPAPYALCVGYRYYRGCDGDGFCKTDATDAYPQEVHPTAGYTLTDGCEDGLTLCAYSDWMCISDLGCRKRKDKLRCTSTSACAFNNIGGQAGRIIEDNVCIDGLDVLRSSIDHCGEGYSCTASLCSGTIYYRGCTGTTNYCKTDNTGALAETINAYPAGNVLTATCGQSTAQCATCHQCDGNGHCMPVSGSGPPPYLGCYGTDSHCCTGVCCSEACCGNDCCTAAETCCAGACNNLNIDINNCGSCGTACSADNATSSCSSGNCNYTCNTGWGNCNTATANWSDGCETNLNTNVNNCGSCGTACSADNATGTCDGGICDYICNTDWGNCDNDWSNGCEINLLNDWHHCGYCDGECDWFWYCQEGACIEGGGS